MTRLVDAEDFGVRSLGRLFAFIYGRNLDAALPHPIHEIEQ